jgi:ribosomal-protein-alanine N-acetyltransferase
MAECRKYNLTVSESSSCALSIRDYKCDEALRLHQIDQVCFPSDIAFSRGELLFYLNHPKSITLVAERAGRIMGFVLGRILPDHLAHVLTLDVLPEARRQRIGTHLMDSLHGEFRSRAISRVLLEVSISNEAARRLYEALQYRSVEILRGYYNGREDACRMELFL